MSMPDMNPNNGNINDVLRRFSQELERQRIEIDRLKTQRVPATGDDGWLPAMETWTYASATTFTVAGDVRSKYPVGTKIKLTQTTVKYFYVVATSYASPNTTVTITGGSDYSLANATITNNYLSYVETPQGFPEWFNYSATVAATSGTLTTAAVPYAQFKMTGKTIQVRAQITITTNGTGAGTLQVSLPISYTSSVAAGAGREWAVGGRMIQIDLANTNYMHLRNYDNSYPGGDGRKFNLSMEYV